MPPETVATDPPAVAAPAVAAPAVAPIIAPPPAAPTVSAPGVSMPTEAFNERLAQAKRSAEADLLKSLGVTDVAAAQAAIKAANDAAEKNKTDAQRVLELTAQLAASNERADVYATTLKQRAGVELALLSEPQRAAVVALAGEDAGAQILAIDALKPTWSAQSAAAAPAATAAGAATTNTAPPRDAPAPTPGAQPDPYQTYLALRAKNPFAAANYRMQHAAAVADGESKKT